MVKKFLSVFAVASTMLATSCSNEEFGNGLNGNEADVTFTAQLPEGLQSRAFGDGATANTLSYAVYLKNQNGEWSLTTAGKNDEVINMSKTVSLRLVNGNTYQVVFWADAESSVYTFDGTNRKVTANYSNITSNKEELDAFFAVEEITVNGASSKNVELKRPFAQLNIGTSDLTAATTAGTTVSQAGIKVKTYNILNFDGSVDGLSEVTFGLANLPTGKTFPVAGNYYLTMNYLLMPADKETYDVTVFYNNAQVPERTFNNVPLQRNYRTNIYGALLTSMNDMNVVITPDFNTPSTDITAWDGQTMTEPQKVENVYLVATAAEWVWLTQNVTATGVHIKLLDDIDFGGNLIGSIAWLGTLDGNGKTLSNMTVSVNKTVGGAGGQGSIGLFKDCIDAASVSVKNLTIKNIKIDNNNKNLVTGALLGGVNFNPNTEVIIDGVTIDNADIQGVSKVGGLIGMIGVCNKVTVSNTTVKNSYIHNYSVAKESGYVCGLVGAVQNNLHIKNNVVLDNNTILGVYAGDTYNRPSTSIQAIAATRGNNGTITGTATVTNGSVSAQTIADVTITTAEELKAFAEAVNAGSSYDGKVIVLANDINLGGAEWKPIGQTGGDTQTSPARYFHGTFDGGNHTISNFKITEYEDRTTGTYASGFFGFLDAGKANVVNLNLDNVTVKGHHWCGAVVGYLSEGIVSNCSVTNAYIECSYLDSEASGDKAGVITGYINDGSIKNCHAENCTVKAGRDAGQIVGGAKENQVSNCSATNVSVSRYNEQGTGANIREEIIGRIL